MPQRLALPKIMRSPPAEVAAPVVAVAFPTESPKNLVHNIPDIDAHWSIIVSHNEPRAMGYNARNDEIRDNLILCWWVIDKSYCLCKCFLKYVRYVKLRAANVD